MIGIDAHHHLWDPAIRDYPWMTGPAAVLRRRYGLDDLRAVTSDTNIERTVVVQAIASVAETEDLLTVAAASQGLIAGVVGWLDLTATDLADQIARLRELPGSNRLVGIRQQVHDETDPEWLGRDDVLRGLRTLSDAGLAYDLLVRTRELPAAVAVARQLPDVSFVLDHGAKPPLADRDLDSWRSWVTRIAELPNVTGKLSGLVTEARWESWTIADLRPAVDHLITAFSPDRLLFGSDWPVCTLAAPYKDVLGSARELLSELSPAESAAVFGANAARVYGL